MKLTTRLGIAAAVVVSVAACAPPPPHTFGTVTYSPATAPRGAACWVSTRHEELPTWQRSTVVVLGRGGPDDFPCPSSPASVKPCAAFGQETVPGDHCAWIRGANPTLQRFGPLSSVIPGQEAVLRTQIN